MATKSLVMTTRDDRALTRSTRDAETIATLQRELSSSEIERATTARAMAAHEERARELERALARAEDALEEATSEMETKERTRRDGAERLARRYEALARRVEETERAARREREECVMYKTECESLRQALEASTRELGAMQVDAARGKSAASEAKNFKREIDRARREKDAAMSAIRAELADARRRATSLEASSTEVKRILGDALGEELGERDAATVAARRVADAMRDTKARLQALERVQHANSADGASTLRNSTSSAMEDDVALVAETEAALEEALGTARRWKSAAEKERTSRERIENELDDCRSSLARAIEERSRAESYERELEAVVERLGDRIRALESASPAVRRDNVETDTDTDTDA